ncbi:hypothetical protein L1987_42311 [Smallanthus sonchifolius]|uniref:Uncharacterized protein n=1 Tax=Smallanthus sonchifolius TaxID=185202 RepID=A0ACB9GJH5_9ASTR|nr:hypothetical protein L1987_42311 [Smallanthus sonchifolius]
MDIDTSNRFSVLDIPNSIKHNKLVEAHDDLYPPDHGLVDGMDVETVRSKSSVSVDIVDQWCPGQWDYFNDLCTLMGLDPDYCIEDVDSDSENGTSLFLSGLLKSGFGFSPNLGHYGLREYAQWAYLVACLGSCSSVWDVRPGGPIWGNYSKAQLYGFFVGRRIFVSTLFGDPIFEVDL